MEDTPLVALRRRLLRQEVEAHGNAEIARAAKKPDRQIADLVNGRASFGDRIARQLESLRPDRPAGWLVLGFEQPQPGIDQERKDIDYLIASRADAQTRKTLKAANELLSLWIELPAARRQSLIASLRQELGRNPDADAGLLIKPASKESKKRRALRE